MCIATIFQKNVEIVEKLCIIYNESIFDKAQDIVYMKRIIPAVLLIFLMLTLCFASCSKEFELTVALSHLEGANVVIKENPVKVKYGKNATFDIDIGGGKEIIAVSRNGKELTAKEYSVEGGVLTVYDVTEPMTLMLSVGKSSQKCVFEISSNTSRGGGASSSPMQGRVEKGTVVTFSASPNDGAVFLGWSSGKTLAEGGTLLSKNEQYTRKITSDMTVFANYDASKVKAPTKKPSVMPDIPVKKPEKPQKPSAYQPSRNELINLTYVWGENEYTTDFCIDFYSMPNTLPEVGIFTLEGHVPTGYLYNGEYVGFGHKFVSSGKDNILEVLFEKAEDEANFTYSVNVDKVKIEKYNGSSDKIYIPKTIGGLTVAQIGEGAFEGCNASYVYIPSGVVNIADGAFKNCKKLTEITIFDSVMKLSDMSFGGCHIKTVNLHAATAPRYTETDLMFSTKYERFVTAPHNRIIIISGSSKHFGFDSDYADELCGGRYTFVNYGTNAQMNVVFYLEAMANLAEEGDIILLAPEQYGPFCDTVNGNRNMTALTFQGCEGCYQLVSKVDAGQYINFFGALSQYCSQRSSRGEKTYESRSWNIDKYGDCSISRKNYNSDSYRNGANGTFYFKKDTIPEEFSANLNRILGIAKDRGIPSYLSFPPYNKNACDPSTLNDEGFEEYMTDMENVVDAILVSDVRNYIIEGKYFFNTDYHLMEEGARMHTEQTVADIMTALDN